MKTFREWLYMQRGREDFLGYLSFDVLVRDAGKWEGDSPDSLKRYLDEVGERQYVEEQFYKAVGEAAKRYKQYLYHARRRQGNLCR